MWNVPAIFLGGWMEENHENPQPGYLMSGVRLETGTPGYETHPTVKFDQQDFIIKNYKGKTCILYL
jgi:hypothetical protein